MPAGHAASRVRALVRTVLDHSVLLPVGALAGLAWANVAGRSYERFADALHFVVNDVGMAFFFALATKEVVEATAPGGALSSARRAATPILAALGGMIVPAAIYLVIVRTAGEPGLARGWAIPSATDIAFSYLTARFVLGPRHPAIPFLLLLAIADDAFGLLILAGFYPIGELHPREFVVLLLSAAAIAYWLRRRGVLSFWPYVIVAGSLSWLAFWRGGFHPALALVPIVPFLPHAARDPGLFVDAPATAHDTLSELERWWKTPVEWVLFAFGLVNAGVPFESVGVGTWAVLAAILVGKPIGIVGLTLLANATGLGLSRDLGWRDVFVAGCAAAIGFTVALFFATAAFPAGPFLAQTKTGALLSVAGALMATIAAAGLRVGRFAKT
ncbi:MAG: Na+/H+ antiporter NhaA [Acidobacteria bacterium]|nr:Na+/H+ antiporter NhaA [Acidobacteriota bacterium]